MRALTPPLGPHAARVQRARPGVGLGRTDHPPRNNQPTPPNPNQTNPQHDHQDGKLYIGNLAFKTTEDGLRDAFQGHGEITFARVISDRDTGRSRSVELAGLCVCGMDGVVVVCGWWLMGPSSVGLSVPSIVSRASHPLAYPPPPNHPSGFGFVTFATKEEAQAAIDALNETELDGRTIRVNFAQPRDPNAPRPPRRSACLPRPDCPVWLTPGRALAASFIHLNCPK